MDLGNAVVLTEPINSVTVGHPEANAVFIDPIFHRRAAAYWPTQILRARKNSGAIRTSFYIRSRGLAIGMVPSEKSSGGKQRLGHITKEDDSLLCLLWRLPRQQHVST